jgi:hypothetical protein
VYRKSLERLQAEGRVFLVVEIVGVPPLTCRGQGGDLAGIREAVAFAKLPAEERAACQKLWVEVAAMMKKAAGKP